MAACHVGSAANRTAVTTPAGTESYTLDALNRLTSVSYPNGDVVGYSYDAAGNRLTQVVNGVTTNTYTYDDAGELTSDAVQTYAYDASGNLIARGSDTFAWDYADRLTSATVGGTTATYAYDGDGVRVSKALGGVTTSYLWDRPANGSLRTGCSCNANGGAPLPLLIDDGDEAYLQMGGLLAEVDVNNAATYPIGDALGSVRGLTDGAGAITGTANYDVFGAIRNQTGAAGVFGFTGEQRDAVTGFTYLRARHLNPALGRFVSQDTMQPNADGTQGWNEYAYVANNPTTLVDPSGRHCDPVTLVAIIMLIVGQMAGWTEWWLESPLWITAAWYVTLMLFFIGIIIWLISACLNYFGGIGGPPLHHWDDPFQRNSNAPESSGELTRAPTAFPAIPIAPMTEAPARR